MKHILRSAIAIGITLSFSACDFINSKILQTSVKGTYLNHEGYGYEFSDTKVTFLAKRDNGNGYHELFARSYKIEDGNLYIEKVASGELSLGDFKFKILHPDTIKMVGGGLLMFKENDKDPKDFYIKTSR